MTAFTLTFPDYFDGYAAEIAAKGYFADVTIVADKRRFRPVFYDPTRFGQETSDALAAYGFLAEANIVIVEHVTRNVIVSTVAKLAASGFACLRAEP